MVHARKKLLRSSTSSNNFHRKWLRKETEVAFIDLACAYDTVLKEGLFLKLHKLVPCRTFSRLTNEMMSDRLFQVHLNGKRSRFRNLQNGLPQGSTLSPLLFNIYTSDVPPTTSRKFKYADDKVLGVQDKGLLK